jgi:hypothetical protein
MNDQTKITITVNGPSDFASVTVMGEGDLAHYIQAMQAALMAQGFALSVVAKIGKPDE